MSLLVPYNNRTRMLTTFSLVALIWLAGGCSLIVGTITTDPPPSPPKILDVRLTSDHQGYGETKIKISIEFEDRDGDMGETEFVSYTVEQIMQSGDFCWILPRPRTVLKREPITGTVRPEIVTMEPGGLIGTIIIRVYVAIWPENAYCTAKVTVTLTDRAGNKSAPRDQIIRLYEGYL